jgi:hypothetical protein
MVSVSSKIIFVLFFNSSYSAQNRHSEWKLVWLEQSGHEDWSMLKICSSMFVNEIATQSSDTIFCFLGGGGADAVGHICPQRWWE